MVGGMIAATASTLQLTEIKQMAVNGRQVACLTHWTGVQPGGGVLDVDNIDVYTIDQGKIVEATIYSQDVKQKDYFWGHQTNSFGNKVLRLSPPGHEAGWPKSCLPDELHWSPTVRHLASPR